MLKKIAGLAHSLRKVLLRPMTVLLVFLVILCVSLAFLFIQYRKTQDKLNQLSNTQSKEEVQSLLKTVGKLVDLPSEEQPTVATVTDREKLQDQPFFNRSQNGDKVLIFTNAKRAVLYRPSINKIVDITSLNTTQETVQTTKKVLEPLKVSLYNGTLTAGLTNKAGETIKTSYPQLTVSAKGNAVRSDYLQTQVVDITGSNLQLAQQLATTFNGKVTELPEGEVKPDTELLIILAK